MKFFRGPGINCGAKQLFALICVFKRNAHRAQIWGGVGPSFRTFKGEVESSGMGVNECASGIGIGNFKQGAQVCPIRYQLADINIIGVGQLLAGIGYGEIEGVNCCHGLKVLVADLQYN